MTALTGGLPDGYRLITLEEATSTNQVALERVQSGEASDGDIILAKRQTAGRGRQGRPWESPDGNLFMSIVVRHDGALETAAQLSFIAAIATHAAIDDVAAGRANVACKWPNDVLINDRKTAGILLEVGRYPGDAGAWIVVGIGVNLASPPTEARFPATCLEDTLGVHVLPVVMATAIARTFADWRFQWQDQGFTPVRGQWLSTAFALNNEISVRNGDQEASGIFEGIDHDGALCLKTGDGVLAINAGNVHFPGASAEE